MLMGVTKKYVPITSEAAMTYQMFEVLKVRLLVTLFANWTSTLSPVA